MRTKVLVCVPMGDSNLRGELFAYLWKLQARSLLQPDFPYVFDLLPLLDCHPVEHARNRCVWEFLKSRCDVLWFLDADGIPGDDAYKVLEGNYDVSIGPVPMLIVAGSGRPVLSPNLFSSIGESNIGTLWEPGKEVKAGGTANMAIKRKVLEDRAMWLDDKGSVFKRKYDASGQVEYGEDADFCRRALDKGHSLGAELDAISDHAKTFGLDFFLRVILNQIKKAENDESRPDEP